MEASTERAHAQRRYRAVWVSDVHLGRKDCHADRLLSFLSSLECEHLYLVGDIVDFWALRKRWYWPRSHNAVVRSILGGFPRIRRITFIPGNHDEQLRDYAGTHFGNVLVQNKAVHFTADGRRVLVVHGDEFDAVVRGARLITALGDWLYYVLLFLNRGINRLRRILGRPYWSLAGYVKSNLKTVRTYVRNFESAVARRAREGGFDAVVCGHIHRPALRTTEGIVYANCGDWVESCTALVEHPDGRLELLDLAKSAAASSVRRAPTVLPSEQRTVPGASARRSVSSRSARAPAAALLGFVRRLQKPRTDEGALRQFP